MNRSGHSCFPMRLDRTDDVRQNRNVPNSQSGFILLTVVVAITLLAAIAFVLGYQGASQTGMTTGELERDQLRYVAEAGLAHAKSQLAQNTSCASYTDLPATTFGSGSYSAIITPSNASPVTITATGTLQSGAEQSLVSQPVQAYQPANNVALQLGITSGKDTMIDGFYPNANYGGLDDLTVRSKPSWMQRPLLEFDLSVIPPGVRIISAKLELQQRIVGTAGVIGVHRVARSWEEGTGKGTGNADGATWNEYDGASTWAQSGGDFASTLYATATTTSAKNGGWVAWDIRDLVDAWVAGQYPNYGLILVGDGVVDNAEFESREETDPTAAPKLTISYACECGQVCEGGGSAGNLLLVVVNPGSLTAQEQAKKDLIESWEYTVNLIDDSASQGEFDDAIAANDVAYVAEDIETGQLGTKLREATIGVVIEEEKITDEFGISSGETTFTEASIEVTDNTHYITQPFSLGAVTFSSSAQPVGGRAGTLAPGLAVLALRPSSTTSMLDAIEEGGVLFDTATAAGRRVKLPWGGDDFDINSLTADGLTLMKRAIEWGAGAGAVAASGPMAHWKLDDGTGLTAIDSEGGHDGTLISGGPVWVAGQLGDALDFDGVDDYVDLTSDAELDDVFVGGATVMAWIEPASWGGSGYGRIFDKSSVAASTGDGWAIRLNKDNGGLNFGQGFTTKRGWWRFAESSINFNTWHHVALAYDASSTTNDPIVYLDGSPVTVTRVDTPSGDVRSDAAINLRLGSHASVVFNVFDGKIDDARIYDRMLSAAEIADIADIAAGGGGGGGGSSVLMAVGEVSAPTTVDSDRIKRIEDWGYTVTLIDDGDSASAFATEIAASDVLYIGASTNASTLSGKVESHTIGIVSENASMIDDLGFALGAGVSNGTQMSVLDPSHYVMAGFGSNTVTVLNTTLSMTTASSTMAPDLQQLAKVTTSTPLLVVALEAGALNVQGRSTPGRRIHLPLRSAAGTDLTADGAELIRRAIVWGSGKDVSGGGGGGTFRDEFKTVGSYAGNDGTLAWATDWLEFNESDGASAGDEQVLVGPNGTVAQVQDNDSGGEGLQREANLSGYIKASLTFLAWRSGLDKTSDYVTIDVSANGGSSWTELGRIEGPGTDQDGSPLSMSFDISAYIGPNTRIRFLTSSGMGNTDLVYFDNVQIEVK